jgi:hypothetical protein
LDSIKINLGFNPKFIKTRGLVHYWPFNSHIQDVIGGAHLLNGSNASLINDRYGRPLSALSLNNGTYKMPARNYFLKTNFSFTCWVNLKMYDFYSSLIEFNEVSRRSYVTFLLSANPFSKPKILIRNSGTYDASTRLWSNRQLILNQWIHFGVTYEYPYTNLYYNGSLDSTYSSNQQTFNLTRSFNCIGCSLEYPSDLNLYGQIDELKIFDRALTQEEIEFEMNNNL